MDVLVTCKYEEDLIKNEGARVDTTLYIGERTGLVVSVRLRIRRPGFDPRPGRCVVSLSKRHLLPKSTGNTQE